MFKLSQRSLAKLTGVHPDLAAVVARAIAITAVDFVVTEGLRTVARQRELVKAGASRTMNSRHITGHAVDIAPIIGGKVCWDWPPFHILAKAMKQAALELNVALEWGGDWRSFKDGPHFQLSHRNYPASAPLPS